MPFRDSIHIVGAIAHTDPEIVAEYRRRIGRVVKFIHANPDRKHGLAELAALACFSEFHFSRIFHAFTGETLSSYAHRARMADAAYKIAYRREMGVSAIALDQGYPSPSDFTRAFRKQFGMTPLAYRRRRRYPRIPLLKRFVDSKVERRSMEDLTVACLTVTGLSKTRQSPAVERAFAELYTWVKARKLDSSPLGILGLYPDNPEFIPLDKCRYVACLTVPPGSLGDGAVTVQTLKAKGDYVCFRFHRSRVSFARRFFSVVDYLYGIWLPENGLIPDDKPFFEIYHPSRIPGRPIMDFCIPVLPAT